MSENAEINARSIRAKNLRRAAGQVISQLYLASKLQTMYSADHDNARQAIEQLRSKLDEVFSFEESFRLQVEEGYVFVNGVRLRAERAASEAAEWLLERLGDSGIASILVRPGVNALELRKFVPIFAKSSWPENGPAPPVPKLLSDAFVQNLTVTMRRNRDPGGDEGDDTQVSSRELAIAIWLRLHGAASEIVAAARTGQRISLKRARALIQLAVDALNEDERAVLALTAQKNYCPAAGGAPATSPGGSQIDEPWRAYLESHLANTCLLSLGIGNRLGLERKMLLDLGTAGLTADVGMAFVAEELRGKPGPLDKRELDEVARHGLAGAEVLMRSDEASSVVQLCAAVAAGHHATSEAQFKLSGRAGLFATIVGIADAYDAMTTERPWRAAHSHDEALKQLLRMRGEKRVLLTKVLANLLGVVPAGAVVELTGGEIAVVLDAGKGGPLAGRPRVKVLLDARGKGVSGLVYDLAERAREGGFARGIERVLDLKKLAAGPGDLVALMG